MENGFCVASSVVGDICIAEVGGFFLATATCRVIDLISPLLLVLLVIGHGDLDHFHLTNSVQI